MADSPSDWGAVSVDVGGPASWGAAPVDAVSTNKISTAGAALEGFKKGVTANWSDEISGAAHATGLPDWAETALGGFGAPIGAARLAYEHWSGQPGPATEAYNKFVALAREKQKQASDQHPTASMLGELGGAIVPALAIPGSSAATLPARMGYGAKIGASYGALSGAGAGEDLSSRATGAGIGAVAGGVTGGLIPPVVEGAIQGTQYAARPVINTIRGAINPEGEAARRIGVAATRDFEQSGPSLSPDEISALNLAGTPRAIIDAGGETTRALARSSANTSPEARDALTQFTSDRFSTQNQRTANVIQSITGANADNPATLDALQTAARKANKPAYQKAFQDGDTQIISPEIERLMGSPALVDAMKRAASSGRDKSITEGMGAFNPGVTIENGIVNFKKGPNGVPVYPNLQFWDATKRELDDAASAAMRQGKNSEGSVLGQLSSTLRSELDNIVPSYAKARSGASAAFGAQDALAAGTDFLTSKMENGAAQRAFNALSAPEKTLFKQGYSSALINKVKESGDSRSILNSIAQSPAERERLKIALGPNGADQMEAFLRAEGILDRARTAVSGNSTTVRQLAELGLAGGAYGITSGGDLTNPRAVATGALIWGLTHGSNRVNEAVAKRVGQMLVSDDPDIFRKGIQMAARHSNILSGLRKIDNVGVGAAAEPVASRVPTPMLQLQGPVPAGAQDEQQ